MELRDVRVIEGERIRVEADVGYARADLPPESYWFDFPASQREWISSSANPWLVLLLPLAAELGEPLRLSLPVDPLLLDGAREALEIWQCWFSHPRVIDVVADGGTIPSAPGAGKTVCLFSAGVDSSFSILRHQQAETPRAVTIDEALFLCGWLARDTRLLHGPDHQRLVDALREIAATRRLPLIDVATNLSSTSFMRFTSTTFMSGINAVLAPLLLLERKVGRVIVPSSNTYRDMLPLNSTPLTDRLWSTSSLRVINDGAGYCRLEKITRLAEHAPSLETLLVCSGPTGSNCGRCDKCLRTMLSLDLLGVLDRCPSFPRRERYLGRAGRIYIGSDVQRRDLATIHALALEAGRDDIAARMAETRRCSEWIDRCCELVGRGADQELARLLDAPPAPELVVAAHRARRVLEGHARGAELGSAVKQALLCTSVQYNLGHNEREILRRWSSAGGPGHV